MRKFYALAIALMTTLFVSAQIGVTVTGNTNTTPALQASYTSLAAALTDLNAVTAVSGPVVLNCAAAGSETAPAGGFVVNFTAATSAANNITINGNGSTVTAPTPQNSGALNDAIFKIIGSDNVVLQGFTLLENAANTTTTAGSNNMTEWGVALLYASATDNAQNITIQNNTIDLNRTYQNTFGIYANATHSATAATTSATATGAAGGNHGLKIYSNTITDVNNGIVVVGPTAAADHNDGVQIGGTPATANTISNYGSTGTFSGYANVSGTVYGILIRNTKNYTVSNNNVSSSNGGTTSGTLRGIYVISFSNTPTGNITNAIDNNNISVTTGVASGTLQGITVESGTVATTTTTLSISGNNFANSGYNVASPSGAATFISNAAVTVGININNNTFTNLSITSTGSVTFINNSVTRAANAICNANNNSIVTGFNKTGAGGTVQFYLSNASTPNSGTEINTGNNFSNVTVTGATTIAGWQSTDGTGTSPFGPAKTITNNTFTNITGGTSAVTLLNVGFSNNATSNNVSGNVVNNVTTGGAITGISSANGTQNFFNNTVNGLSTTGGSTVSGMTVSGGGIQNVYNNKVYNLQANNASGAVNGLLISGGTTVTVYNNLIGDLRTPATSANNSLVGLNITGGTTVNVYYNTVYVNGTSTGTNFGSSAISVSTTPTVDLQNNIFVNTSTPAGTGLTVAYRRSSTTLTSYAATSNNNLFYAGTPGTANLIFYDGTNSDQTLSDFKTRVSPRDGASVTEMPPFASTSGAAADFLHINTTIATQVSNGGTPVTGITTDYDGDTRNATTPDIGADEFTGINSGDIASPVISYTPLANSCTAGARTLIATITDPSGVPTSGPGLPVIYWRINAGAYTASTATSLGSNQYQFSLGAGSVTGDVVSYYIVAQDNATTPNVGSSPGAGAAGFTANPPSATTPPTNPTSYTVLATLSGTYTVGTGGNYATLTAAVADYNTKCIGGPVVFSLTDANYSTNETFPIVINGILGASVTNTLTIRPASGVNATISGNVGTGAVIKLNGANYITIDGSNNGSTSRNLTIQNTTSTTSGNAVIWISSPAAGSGSNNNIVKNTIIEGNSASTTFLGMYIGGNATITLTAAGADMNNNNTITNNLFRKTQYGIALFGYAAATPDNNNVISDNNFGTATAGEGFNIEGIHADRQNNLVVSGNDVQNIRSTTGTNMYGIRLLDFKNGKAFNNKVHNMAYTGTSTTKIYGLAVQSSTYTTAGNPSLGSVYNNFIYDITCSGTSAVWNLTGMFAGQGYGDKYYYNTIHLTGQLNNSSSGLSAGFANGDDNITSFGTNLDVRNNIINVEGTSGGGNMWAYYSRATDLSTTTQDYNLIRITTTGSTNYTGRFNGVNYATLAAWQTASSKDANSINTAPVFVSATDLHLVPSSNMAIDNLGTPIAGITTDIDGETRSATAPDMGADEFVVATGADMGVTALVAPSTTGCYTNAETVTVTIKNYSANPINFATVPVTVNVSATGAGTYSGSVVVNSGTLASGASQNVTLPTTINMSAAGTYTFTASTAVAGDATPGNDAMTPAVRISLTLGGTYTVGAGGNYTTLTAAVAAYNTASCITSPVVFNLTDASYGAGETFPIIINANPAAGTNTLTIKPAAGVTATISGAASNSALISLNGADYIIIDGSNNGTSSRNLTVSNTSTTNPTGIAFGSAGVGAGSTNNTIKNLIITTGTSTTGAIGISLSGATPAVAGADNDNATLQNNDISGVTVGIMAYGTAAVSAGGNDNLIINGNTVSINTTTSATGLMLGNDLNSTISNNTISVETSGATSPVGISLETGFNNSTVTGNRITKVLATNTGGWGGRGITVGTGNASSSITIANNMIAGVNGTNWTAFGNSSSMGIAVGPVGGSGTLSTTVGGVNLYHNTVYMSGTYDIATNNIITTALYVGSGATALDVRNNIFANSLANTNATAGSSAKAFAIYSAAANTAFTTIDYNDYYVSGSQGVLGYIGSDRTDLVAIQTGFGSNASSKNVQPFFVSNTDLHLTPGLNSLLDNSGTGIAAITTDIDGDARSATTPDMGADEFTSPGCTGAVGGTISAATTIYCASGTPAITGAGFSTGTGSTYQWQSSPDNTNWTDIAGQTLPTALTLGTAVTTTTYYRLKVTCNTGTAIAYSNTLTITINPLPTVTVTPSGPVNICAPATQLLTGNTNAATPTYQWKNNGTNIPGATSGTYTVSATGVYSVEVVDGVTGCTNTAATVAVTVNPQPSTVTVTPNSTALCAGNVQQLSASGGTVASSGNATLGTATTLTGATSQPTAFCNRWAQYWNQTIYTAAELTAAGLSAGSQINSISYTTTTQGDANNNTNFSISVGHTSNSIFTAFQTTGLSPVYGPTTYTHAVGVNTITFATPFSWDGVSNIVIDVRMDGVDNINNAVTYYTAAPDNKNIEAHTSTTSATTPLQTLVANASVTPNVSTTRLNIVLGYTSSQATSITWTPVTGLYTDAAATVAYTAGTAAPSVYAKPTTTTVYTATSTSSAGCTNAATATVTVNAATAITTQPTAQAACAGANATFTVAASGGPFTYQWRKGGVNITGATSASYTITGVVAGDAGNYDVVVTGGCGTVTSNAVALTVNAATSITTQPAPTYVACSNTSATFTVVAAGSGTLTYQWRKAGVDIAGATSASYTITGLTAGDAGTYDVVVTGSCGSVTSNTTTLTVNLMPSVTTHPANQNVCIGASASFSVVAQGTGNTYQWRKNSVAITGATSTTYTIPSVAAGDIGNYDVIVTNNCGQVQSNFGGLIINAATSISTQPTNQTVCAGANATFTVAAAGAGTLTYQWRKGGTNITGATSASYTINNVAATDAGTFDVVVTGTCGNVTSSSVTLTVNAATSITTQPVAQAACVGANASFTVAAAGTGTLTYQWRKGGTNITGATTNTLTLNNVTATDAANYDVVITSTCGNITSNAVALTVNPKPVTDFSFTTACLGNANVFTNLSTVSAGTITNNDWTFGDGTNSTTTSPSHTFTVAGTYQVKLVTTTNNGCKDSVTKSLTISNCTGIPTVNADISSALLLPNLVEQTAVLRVNAARSAKISWTVLDMQGRSVMRFDQQVNSGQNDRVLYLNQLASGTYQLSGTTEKGKTVTIRFVKQ